MRAKLICILISAVGILLGAFSFASAQSKDTPPLRTASISGHVIISGKAAAGVDVAALGGGTPNPRLPAAITKTDSEGSYELKGLAAGNYQVTTFTAHLTNAEPTSEFPYGFIYVSGRGVVLSAGEQATGVDIKLIRGGVITGRVSDAQNRPLVQERVSLEQVAEPGKATNRLLPPIGEMFLTDDRGIYRLYGLPAGKYRVSVGQETARGYVGANRFYRRTFSPDATDRSKATIIEVSEASETANVDIRVGAHEETYSISGRIIDAETGAPVSSARIGLQYGTGTSKSNITSGLQANADGRFNLPGFTPGHYGIYISTDGESEYYSDPIDVEVVDKDVSGIELSALKGLSISGQFVGESVPLSELLKQIPRLTVTAWVMPKEGGLTSSTITSSNQNRLNPDGTFQVRGLRPGRVSLGVESGDATKPRPLISRIVVGGVPAVQGFEIQRGQPVTGIEVVVAYGSGAIHGSVKFEGGKLPDGWRSTVSCTRDTSRGWAGGGSVDSRGNFRSLGLPAGTYECRLDFMPVGVVGPFRPPRVPNQTVVVSDGNDSELNFVVDLTPKEVGP